MPRLAGHDENFLGDILISESWIAENLHKLYSEKGAALAEHEVSVDGLIVLLNKYLLATPSSTKGEASADLLHYLNDMILKVEQALQDDLSLFDAIFYIHSIRITLFPNEQWPKIIKSSHN